jgi:L-ascorbate metabolism protein UlaG (beta-lactamase superfamily)
MDDSFMKNNPGDESIEGNRKFTRRQVLSMAALGTALMAGGFGMTTTGKDVRDRMSEEFEHGITPAKLSPYPNKWKQEEVSVAWLGHASFVLNLFGTKIVIDPALGDRIGVTPLGDYTFGPKRYISAPMRAEELGPIDLLLVSHAHTDHFDYPTLRKLQSERTTAITASNTLPLWEGMKFGSVKELHWGEVNEVSGVIIRAIEGKHWGARMPWSKGMEANSLLLSKGGVNIFFGADTGYTEKIKEQLTGVPIDLAIMGIAAYSPKSFEARHATPEQAWKIAEEIEAKYIIPMHWGTFRLSQEPMDEPIKRFRQAAQGQIQKIALQEVGDTWKLPL